MASAGATAAAAALNSVVNVFDRVVALATNYYKQSAAWDELQVQVSEGRQLLKVWEQAASDRGLSSEPLNRAVERARRVVEREEAKIQKQEANRYAKLVGTVRRTVMPWQVELSVKAVVDRLKSIPQTLRTVRDVAETIDMTITDCQRFLISFPSDSRYVHLHETEDAITEALEKAHGGCPVVLLYGGAGTGKSTVVRNLEKHYEDKKGSPFDDVVYQDCSSKKKVDYMEFLNQLIRRLGEKPVSDFEPSSDDKRRVELERQVRALLNVRKRLFILDDLIDEKFLLDIVNLCDIFRPRCNVKFLLTSQEHALCGSVDPIYLKKILIQKLRQDTAMELLASHAGFPNHRIPRPLLGVTEKMIAQTDCHPLALAMLGGVISSIAGRDENLRRDQEEWWLLSENISGALKEDRRPNGLFQQPYKNSLWATLELTINENLSADCRNLPLLAHSFAETSFPEEVIRLLYCQLREVEGFFSAFKTELLVRNLISIRTEPTGGENTWHLHSLQKLYIDCKMVDARDSVIYLLIGDGDTTARGGQDLCTANSRHHTVLLILCALYLKAPFAKKAAAKTAGHYHNCLAHSCGNYIRECTRSIARPVTDQWTLEDREKARQEFLSHIYGPVEDPVISGGGARFLTTNDEKPPMPHSGFGGAGWREGGGWGGGGWRGGGFWRPSMRCPICGDTDCVCSELECCWEWANGPYSSLGFA